MIREAVFFIPIFWPAIMSDDRRIDDCNNGMGWLGTFRTTCLAGSGPPCRIISVFLFFFLLTHLLVSLYLACVSEEIPDCIAMQALERCSSAGSLLERTYIYMCAQSTYTQHKNAHIRNPE